MIRSALLIFLPLLVLLSACGGPTDSTQIPEAQAAGDTFADIGDHVVHFSAQSTDQLPPAVAKQYNIVRSKNRAMLNVSVLRESDNTPVSATVTVNTVNLTGQLKTTKLLLCKFRKKLLTFKEKKQSNRQMLNKNSKPTRKQKNKSTSRYCVNEPKRTSTLKTNPLTSSYKVNATH